MQILELKSIVTEMKISPNNRLGVKKKSMNFKRVHSKLSNLNHRKKIY